MKKTALSEKCKEALWNGPSEALEEWIESLATHDTYSYHPLFEIIDAFFDCMKRHSLKRFITGDDIDREGSRERLEFLLELLSDSQGGIGAIGTPIRPEDELRDEVEQAREKCREKNRACDYLLPLDDYKTTGMIMSRNFCDYIAEKVLVCCMQVRLCETGFGAFEIAKRLGDLLRGHIDVLAFSLLLHLLRPGLFPYWGTGFIFERINVDLAHNYSEFEFPEYIPFDHYNAYLENCFLLYCSLHGLVSRIGYVPFTYAAHLLAPSDKD